MLRTRIITGTILAAVSAGVLIFDHWLAPWYPFLFAFVMLVSVAVAVELLAMCPRENRPHRWLTVGLLALLIAANWFRPGVGAWQILSLIFVAGVVTLFLSEMARFREGGRSTVRVAIGVWVLGYLGMVGSCLVQLRWAAEDVPLGAAYWSVPLAIAAFVPKVGDIGAYTAGRIFGRTPFSPVLSPKKTWEGAAGGLLASIAATAGFLYLGNGPGFGWPGAVLLGSALAAASQLGDLAASMLKRDAGFKDSGRTVPGFGGVLDVVDSILFAAPVVYAWWVFV